MKRLALEQIAERAVVEANEVRFEAAEFAGGEFRSVELRLTEAAQAPFGVDHFGDGAFLGHRAGLVFGEVGFEESFEFLAALA